MRPRLRTATTNGPSVHPQMIYEYGDPRWNYINGRNQRTQRKPVPLPLCPQRIPYRMTRTLTRDSALRGRPLTAWATEQREVSSWHLCNRKDCVWLDNRHVCGWRCMETVTPFAKTTITVVFCTVVILLWLPSLLLFIYYDICHYYYYYYSCHLLPFIFAVLQVYGTYQECNRTIT